MASLLARLFPGTMRGGASQEESSNDVPTHSESIRKSHHRLSTNVKARKSITSLFGFAAKGVPAEDGPDIVVHSIATCQEAQHYPIYDPTNPDHEPSAACNESLQNPASPQKRSCRTPTKVQYWKRSPSPRKRQASVRAKSRLQGLADTLRAKANIFYEAQQNSEEELLPQHAPLPLTPSSAKSISSKKSVRFRSGHSVIESVLPQSSPITIPVKSPPNLAMVNISSTPIFDTTSDEEKNLGQTARPREKLLSHLPLGPSPKTANRPKMSLKIEDNFSNVPALPTPMPGTNLPLEDPFDDAAAALHSEHSTNRTITNETSLCKVYVSDEEGDGNKADRKNASVPQARMLPERSRGDASPRNRDIKQYHTSPIVIEDSNQSVENSPSAGLRTIRRIKAIPFTSNEQFRVPRPTSESHYDADSEPSDSSREQKEIIGGVDVKIRPSEQSYEGGVPEYTEFGTALVRCTTPDEVQSTMQGASPRFTVKKHSSDESGEFISSPSTGSEEMLHHTDHSERSFIGVEKSSVPGMLEKTKTQGELTPINVQPMLRPVTPAPEGIENGDPAVLREPPRARERFKLLDHNTCENQQIESRAISQEPSARMCSASSANTISPLHLPSIASSISRPRSPWHLRKNHSTEEDNDDGRLEHHPSFARDISVESTQPSPKERARKVSCATPSPADVPLPISIDRYGFFGAGPPTYSDVQNIGLQTPRALVGPVSPLSLRAQNYDQHTSRNEPGLPESPSSSPKSVYSSRRSSLGRPVPFAEARQSSNHVNRWPTPDISPSQAPDAATLSMGLHRKLPHELSPEAQLAPTQQSRCSSPAAIKAAEIVNNDRTGQRSEDLSTYDTHTFAKSARLNGPCQATALASLVIPALKESSDDSQETIETTPSTDLSSAASSSAVNWSYSAGSEGGASLEHQSDEEDSRRTMISDQRQYLADTLKAEKRDRHVAGGYGRDEQVGTNSIEAEHPSPARNAKF